MAHSLRKVVQAEFWVPWKPRFLSYEDVAEIQRCYVDEDMTTKQIAEIMMVSQSLVGRCIKAVRADLVKLGEKQPRTQGQRPRRKRA